MAVLAAGTSAGEFPEAVEFDVTTDTSRLSDHVAEGISLTGTSPQFSVYDGDAVSEIWVSFDMNIATPGSGWRFLAFRDAANNRDLFHLILTGGNSLARLMQVRAFTPSITALASPSESWSTNTTYRVDMFLKLSNTVGEVKVYRDGTLVVDETGIDTILNTSETLDQILLLGQGTTTFFSSIIVADEDTRGMTYVQGAISGDGALQEMTGDYMDIDGTGVDDETFIVSDAADERSTFTKGAIPSAFNTGYDVAAVVVSARARGDSSLRCMVTSDGTPAFGGDVPLDVTFGAVQHIFTQDPDTAAAWTISGANAAQVGVQSREAG